jgi:hypothetical protein
MPVSFDEFDREAHSELYGRLPWTSSHLQVIRAWKIQRTQKNKWSPPPTREPRRERGKKLHSPLGDMIQVGYLDEM